VVEGGKNTKKFERVDYDFSGESVNRVKNRTALRINPELSASRQAFNFTKFPSIPKQIRQSIKDATKLI
jgi:hypothetical protein